MATTTSPDNIYVLESSDPDDPLAWQPAMATSVQNALNSRALNQILDLAPLFLLGTPADSPIAVMRDGWVNLLGGWQVAASGGRAAVAYNTTELLLTLPVGWRPTRQYSFPSQPFGAAAQITAGVRVWATGEVHVYMNNGGSGATTAVFSLGAVRFPVGN